MEHILKKHGWTGPNDTQAWSIEIPKFGIEIAPLKDAKFLELIIDYVEYGCCSSHATQMFKNIPTEALADALRQLGYKVLPPDNEQP